MPIDPYLLEWVCDKVELGLGFESSAEDIAINKPQWWKTMLANVNEDLQGTEHTDLLNGSDMIMNFFSKDAVIGSTLVFYARREGVEQAGEAEDALLD